MAYKKIELNVNGAISVVVTDAPRKALAAVGVILPPGHRASAGKTYTTSPGTGSLPVTYKVIVEEKAEVTPVAAPVAPAEPAVEWPAVPPRGRRSRSLFGVVGRSVQA